MPSKKLFLLDGMALIFRAHFALMRSPRINSKGINTNAPMGFLNALLDVLQKEQPTHIAVAFDTSAPTFRHERYPEYKAHRQETPEDIVTAIPIVKRLVQAFRIPLLEIDGYEADDVIGTFAKRAAREDFEVYMMTPDKDYAQLVEEHIYMYRPSSSGSGVEVLGVPEVLEKYQLQDVDQVRDLLGLQGDTSDNIPGIPGVGPKTATQLLQQYGTVEQVIAHAAELKGKLKERVELNADLALLSKELATIFCEVPLPFDVEALHYDGYDEVALKALFDELEFRQASKRLFGEGGAQTSLPGMEAPATAPAATPATAAAGQLSLFGAPRPAAATATKATATAAAAPAAPAAEAEAPASLRTISEVAHDYHLIDTPELCAELLGFLKLQSWICFDTETTSLQPLEAELVGMSFCWRAYEAYYVPFPPDRTKAQELLELFRPLFEDASIGKVGQNLKYDSGVLAGYGVEVRGPRFDTMLAHYLLQPDGRHGMDALARHYLQYDPISIETLIGKKGKGQKRMDELPAAQVCDYAAEDADVTWQLYQLFAPMLKEMGQTQLFEQVEVPLIQVLSDMERNGVRIDTAALEAYSQQLEQELQQITEAIHAIAGQPFNISSPKQLGEVLFDQLKLVDKPKKTPTGQYATGEEVLQELAGAHPIVGDILEYRQMQKLKSTYVDALPKLILPQDGLIHTSYNQTVAATGRLSSTDPNLQNIPIRTDRGKEIRRAFIPRSSEFLLLSADYSQVELRIMAAFSGDAHMIEAFRQGKDIHTATAAKVFGVSEQEVTSDMRRTAKTANFGIIYGVSAFGLSQQLNIPRREAGALIEQYFEQFPGVKQYMDISIAKARETGYAETIMGRRRYLRDIDSRNATIRGMAERNAINTPIQGSAADIIKKAMVDIHAWMHEQQLRSKLIMQVHDELVFDMHREEASVLQPKVKELMENAYALSVPLVVETGVGENWLEAH